MEDFVIVVLCLSVLVLAVKQSARTQQLRELLDQLKSFDGRLTKLEVAPKAPVTATAVDAHEAPLTTPPLKVSEEKYSSAYPGFVTPKPPQIPPPEPAAAPLPAIRRWPAVVTVKPSPPTTPLFTAEPRRSISLEERLGQNWLNKLGIVTLVIGLALFLGFKLETLGPLGKSAIGMTLSLVMLGGGLLLERRDRYRIFARAAIGGGWALTYFVTFAMYHVEAMKVIPSQAIDLVLMLLIALAMVWHSLHYRSQVVTSLAFLLAFLTVGISDITLFSLVSSAILAVGLIYVATRQRWYELGLCGLAGLYLNHFLWLHRVLPEGGHVGVAFPEMLPSAVLLLFYWLLFRLFYILRPPMADGPATQRQELVSSLTAVLNSVGLLSLLKYQSAHPEWAFAGLLVLGAMEMSLAFLARPRFRTGFVILSTIGSMLLLAAIPFRFNGSSWSLLWLLEAEMLFLLGVRLKEDIFRSLGLLAGFAVTAQMIVTGVAPIFDLRQSHADTSHHGHVAVAVFAAAILFWFNAEFASRRWPLKTVDGVDRGLFGLTTFSAAGLTAIGLWIVFPGAWTAVSWLLASLLLAACSDRLKSSDLAIQTDLLSLAAVIRVFVINLNTDVTNPHWGAISPRALTTTLAAALLYLNMRRKTLPQGVEANYIPAAYSWAAGILLGVLVWFELKPEFIAIAWGVLGLALFECGLGFRSAFFRCQGYVLFALSFLRIFVVDLTSGPCSRLLCPRYLFVVSLISIWLWVYFRLTSTSVEAPVEKRVAPLAAWFGMIAGSALLYVDARNSWVTIAWSALALVLLVACAVFKRVVFAAQALTLLLAAAGQALAINLFSGTSLPYSEVNSRIFCVGTSCALMLLALPAAFAIRRQHANEVAEDWRRFTLYRPEQPFFFVPLGLLTTLLAVELRAGTITIGWSALGVLTFLFALTVKERSYRLAGLGLLLLGVAKILIIDIWAAAPSDRYITLIVMGAALLMVSFLYSRYRETLLKLL